MYFNLIGISKKQLLLSITLAILIFSEISAFAADPGLRIDATTSIPPLCGWTRFRNDRIDANNNSFGNIVPVEIFAGALIPGLAPVVAITFGIGELIGGIFGGSGCEGNGACYSVSGRTIASINGIPIHRFNGVIATGCRPAYCYIGQDKLTTVPLGSRGDTVCPRLDDVVQFASSNSGNGKFTISWAAFTAEKCTLSGKDPATGKNFSEDFKGESGGPLQGSRTYDYVQRGIYSYKFSCDGVLDNSKSAERGKVERKLVILVGDIPPAPTVTLKVDPDNIKSGESATLSWKAENAVAVSINQGIGVVTKEGSRKVSPKSTTRYTITAAGEFAELGLASYSASLRVGALTATPGEVAPPVEVPPDQIITAAPEVKREVGLLINGQKGPLTIGAPANITLSWKANQYCIAYGSWLGIKTKASEERRTLTSPGTYTYKLYCPGLGSEEIKVNVTGIGGSTVAMPAAEASISLDNINFKKSIHIIRGKATHLWLSAGYDVNGDGRVSHDADGGWSSLLTDGGTCDWNYDLNQGMPVFDVAVGDPKSAKDCTVDLGEVTFYDQPGVYSYGALRLTQVDGKVSSISSINIAVDAPPPPDTAPIIDLQVNGIKDKVTLGAPAEYFVNWSVRNADTCVASDDWSGDRFLSGSQKFVASSKRDLSYTLTCVGKLGTTAANILVKVAELPVCDFSALPTTLDKSSVFERESVLTWKCQFANTCAINPSTGVSTGTFGSVRVSPSVTTNYTLTCQNLDGISSFDQVVELK